VPDGSEWNSARQVVAYPWIGRLAAAGLAAVRSASPPAILALVVLATDPPIMPPDLIRLVVIWVAAPSLALYLIARAYAVRVAASVDRLLLERHGLRIEIPFRAIVRVVPWIVPLPEPGLSLQMQTGRRLPYALAATDPAPVLEALAAAGGAAAARGAFQHPSILYACARVRTGTWRWWHYALKFVLFPLAPAGLLFNAHQHIAYGGTLGEYYLFGLRSYLETFALYWITTVIDLVLWAATWRLAGECAALLAAWLAPARAAGERRAVEIICRLAYYLGVPIVLVRLLGC